MVWCDVDDVIVDTSELMELTLRRMTGKAIPSETWPHHGFAEIYGFGSGEMEKLRGMWMEDGLLERAPLRAGVSKALSAIEQAGCSIGLITARSWHPQGEALTWAMAAKHGLPVSEVVVLSYEECKAQRLAAMGVRVDGFVDDTHRHVRACLSKGWRACLMSQPWNHGHDDLPRVSGLADFAAMFQAPAKPGANARKAAP